VNIDNSSKTQKGESERLDLRLAAAGGPILSALAEIEARREARARRFVENLESTLRADHPAMTALKKRLELSTTIEQGLRTQAERLKRRPTISGGQSLVYGIVLDWRGQPLPGMRLSLVAEATKSVVAETTSDEYGDFGILICPVTGSEAENSKPAWRLVATAEDGAVQFSSEQPFALGPSASVYIEIRLPEQKIAG
jgi:hypothetical protein